MTFTILTLPKLTIDADNLNYYIYTTDHLGRFVIILTDSDIFNVIEQLNSSHL